MPQFSIEVSWVEVFKLLLWWLTILWSFHLGRVHGYQKIPEGPKDSKVDEVKDVPPQVDEVNEVLPEVFMAKQGKALHTTSSCRYLKPDQLVHMSWCTSCTKHWGKRSKMA
jgi:hypothetical protein